MALADPVCRNVNVNGRRTSLRLEAPVWEGLNEIAAREKVTLADLCSRLEKQSGGHGVANLTSVLRAYVLTYFRDAATEMGHRAAGHGTGDVFPARAAGDETVSNRSRRGRRPASDARMAR